VSPAPPPSPPEQPKVAPRFITLSIGYGLSAAETPQGTTSATAGGLYVAGEYGAAPYSFLQLRLYAGFLGTSTDQSNCRLAAGCNVSEDIGFLGSKFRLLAPIPWVAPFVELGLGLSYGTIHATDVSVDRTTSGATVDVPFAFGVAVGERHNIDFAISYLFHLGAQAFAGALSIGVALPAP
jgi:hypothetical protein